jgi:hypothetical protein
MACNQTSVEPCILQIVAARPSLIGLDVESNVKRIVEYLRSREYPEGDIIAYLKSSV